MGLCEINKNKGVEQRGLEQRGQTHFRRLGLVAALGKCPDRCGLAIQKMEQNTFPPIDSGIFQTD